MNRQNVKSMYGFASVHFFLFWAEFFLAVRFVLHFFAVNPTNGFAAWILNSTNALVTPFRSVFTPTVSGHPHFVDLQLLFIMAVYAVVAAVLTRAMHWGYHTPKK
jgi:hypothetical protein